MMLAGGKPAGGQIGKEMALPITDFYILGILGNLYLRYVCFCVCGIFVFGICDIYLYLESCVLTVS